MSKPAFNPNAAYEPVSAKPAFNPDAAYEPVGVLAPQDNGKPVIEAGEADIGLMDRFKTKNFSSNPESTKAYLEQQYPNMEFAIDGDSEVIARNKGDANWKRMDAPETTWRDGLDVVTDVGQGIGEGVAGGLAALGIGATTANPYLAAVGGAGAAGAIGAGAEYAKQYAGEYLGIPNNINHTNAATSGLVSAAMPGVGAGIKSAWGLGKKVAAPIASALSDIPTEVIKNINVDKAGRDLIKSMGVDGYADYVQGQVSKGLRGARNAYGKLVGDASGNGPINVANVKAQAQAFKSQMTPRELDLLQPHYDELYKLSDTLQGDQVTQAKNYFYGVGQGDKSVLKRGSSSTVTEDFNPLEREFGQTISQGFRDSLYNAAPDKKVFDDAYKGYSDFAKTTADRRNLAFTDKVRTQNLLESYNNPLTDTKQEFKDTFVKRISDYAKQGGSQVDLPTAAREYQSYGYFNDPKWLTRNGKEVSKKSILASPKLIKGVAEMSPWIESKANSAAKKIYASPISKNDKLLYNLLSNENER